MSKIVLIDTDDAGLGKYILFGTAVVAAFGVDTSGRYVDEVMDAEVPKAHSEERNRFRDEHGPDAIHGRWAIGQARHMVFLAMLAELEFGEGVSVRLPTKQRCWFNSASPRADWLHQNTSMLS